MGVLAIVLALIACVSFGAGAVFQKRGVTQALPGIGAGLARAPRGRLAAVRDVLGNGAWLAGFGLEMLGWLAYVVCVAVIGGELVAVQPIVGSSIVVTIVLGVVLLGERPSRGEWVATAMMGAGGVCTVVAQVARGDAHGDEAFDVAGLVAFASFIGVLGVTSLVAIVRKAKAVDIAWAMLAAACFCGSIMSTRLSGVVYRIDFPSTSPGVGSLVVWSLTSPAVWAMFVFSWGGFILTQSAYRHGHVSVIEPLIAFVGLVLPSLGGIIVFHEPFAPAAVASGTLLVVGFVLLLMARRGARAP